MREQYLLHRAAIDEVVKLAGDLNQQEESKATSEMYLKELYGPFPELGRRLAKPPQPMVVAEKAMTLPKPVATLMVEEKPWNKLPTTSNPSTTRFLLYALYFYLLAAFVAHFDHCVFLDLLVALLLFGAIQLNTPLLIQSLATKCVVAIAAAALLGTVWLAVYTRRWWNTGYVDNFSMLTARRISVGFEFLLMLARAVAVGALLVAYHTLQKGADEFVVERPEVIKGDIF